MRHQVDQLAELLLGVAHQRFQLDRVFHGLGMLDDMGAEVGILLGIVFDLDPLQALDDQPDGAVGHAQHAMDDGHGADAKDVVGRRFVGLRVLACEQADDARLSLGQRLVDQTHRARLANRQRKPHHGIDDHPAQRQNGQLLDTSFVQLLLAVQIELLDPIAVLRSCFSTALLSK